jgi:hypothetical protein
MATTFEPKLSVLPPGQQRLWSELADVPESFVLCGGTAIALQLGHRTSRDLDFLASEEFDPDSLQQSIPFLQKGQTIQKSANTLTCVVDRSEPVHVSFFGTPTLRFIKFPLKSSDNGVRIASLLDLSGMKAAVVQKRAEAKDYIDLDAIISHGPVDLAMALASARLLYGSAFNPQLTLKSLCFYGDGNLATVPQQTRERLVSAIRGVNLNQLPEIERESA